MAERHLRLSLHSHEVGEPVQPPTSKGTSNVQCSTPGFHRTSRARGTLTPRCGSTYYDERCHCMPVVTFCSIYMSCSSFHVVLPSVLQESSSLARSSSINGLEYLGSTRRWAAPTPRWCVEWRDRQRGPHPRVGRPRLRGGRSRPRHDTRLEPGACGRQRHQPQSHRRGPARERTHPTRTSALRLKSSAGSIAALFCMV